MMKFWNVIFVQGYLRCSWLVLLHIIAKWVFPTICQDQHSSYVKDEGYNRVINIVGWNIIIGSQQGMPVETSLRDYGRYLML